MLYLCDEEHLRLLFFGRVHARNKWILRKVKSSCISTSSFNRTVLFLFLATSKRLFCPFLEKLSHIFQIIYLALACCLTHKQAVFASQWKCSDIIHGEKLLLSEKLPKPICHVSFLWVILSPVINPVALTCQL